ncbi:MAG: hypothetical protein Q9M41_00675 [Paracoccaceae bacterium]|nr:hypothetical protein [Paracoccaceae bacterium]
MQGTNTDIAIARQMLAEHRARNAAQIVLGQPDGDSAPEQIDRLIAALAPGRPLILGLLEDAPDRPYFEARLIDNIDGGAVRLLDKEQAVTVTGAPTTLYLLEKT